MNHSDVSIPEMKRRSPVRKLLRDPQALICSGFLLVVAVLGIFSPILATHDPNFSSLDAVNAPVGSPGYPLGGDQSGRDIYSRLLFSINTASISAVVATVVAVVLGLVLGLIAGYFGTRTRSSIDWFFNLLMTFPGMLLLIILVPVTGGDYVPTMTILGITMAPMTYRIVRALTVGVKNELYVDAARVSGLPSIRILARHVLPIVRGPVIISTAFLAGSAIIVQSGLAFLGVGANDVPSFGAMISSGFDNLYIDPSQLLWPALLLGLITATLVLFGNSLRDVLGGADADNASAVAEVKIDRSYSPAVGVAGEFGGPDESRSLLEVRDLSVSYFGENGVEKKVVDSVSFSVQLGQTVGLVGESGSGKTQTAFAVLGVLPTVAQIRSGSIRLDGEELLNKSEKQMLAVRGRSVSYVPQEPMANLDPSTTVGSQLVEGVQASLKVSRRDAKQQALALLKRVGIQDPDRVFRSYPHQISGGMAQRVLIAGAVAAKPKLLIADEPTTALDVTVQAEILDLLRDLQKEMGMAILLVTHNFGVVADICERLVVMKSGEIVEVGAIEDVFRAPKAPYTRKLLDSILEEGKVRADAPIAPAEADLKAGHNV